MGANLNRSNFWKIPHICMGLEYALDMEWQDMPQTSNTINLAEIIAIIIRKLHVLYKVGIKFILRCTWLLSKEIESDRITPKLVSHLHKKTSNPKSRW